MKKAAGFFVLFISLISFANPSHEITSAPDEKPSEKKAEVLTEKSEISAPKTLDSSDSKFKVSFPQVLSWKNNPEIEIETKKKVEIKKDLQLKTAFKVVTGPKDEIVIHFHGGEKIEMRPQAKMSVPQVSPDSGEVSELHILDGTIRFSTDTAMNRESKLRVKSPFFDLSLPADLDVFITVDMRQPSVRFQVIKGEMTAMFFDFEKTQELKSGDSVTFSGERDGDGIKYDVLLNGRKAPRGVLHQVEKFDYQGYLAQEKVKNETLNRELEKKKKEEALRIKKQKDYRNSFLCKNPYGQKDQCYWLVQDKACYRFRCNVSGQWGDKTERPMTDLCTQNKAKPCDY